MDQKRRDPIILAWNVARLRWSLSVKYSRFVVVDWSNLVTSAYVPKLNRIRLAKYGVVPTPDIIWSNFTPHIQVCKVSLVEALMPSGYSLCGIVVLLFFFLLFLCTGKLTASGANISLGK